MLKNFIFIFIHLNLLHTLFLSSLSSLISLACVLFVSLNPPPQQQQSKIHLQQHLCQSPLITANKIISKNHQAPSLTTKSTKPNHKQNPLITICSITRQTHQSQQTQSPENLTDHIKQIRSQTHHRPNPLPLSSLTKIDPHYRRRSTSGGRHGGDQLKFFPPVVESFKRVLSFFFSSHGGHRRVLYIL